MKHTHVLDLDNAFSISTRELRENIEGKNDTIASVLNELAPAQARDLRGKRGARRDLKTGSRITNWFPFSRKKGNRYKFNQYKWL